MTNKEVKEIELCVRFRGEEESTFFYVSLKNAEKLGADVLDSLADIKKLLKDSLIKAIREKDLCVCKDA